MCGIFCTILYNQNTFLNEVAKKGNLKNTNPQFAEFHAAFERRGPDCYDEINEDLSSCTLLQFAASVLWTQGPSPVKQPVRDEDGNILLWNGDIFGGPLASSENDTRVLSVKLQEAVAAGDSIPELMAQIKGPYSFIYYEKDAKTLWFGRDAIGRHSLVISTTQRSVVVSSIAAPKSDPFIEVPAVGIFAFSLVKDGEMPLTLYPWAHCTDEWIRIKLEGLQTTEKCTIGDRVPGPLIDVARNCLQPTEEELEMWVTCTHDPSVSQLMDKLSVSDSRTRIREAMEFLSEKPDIEENIDVLLRTLTESVEVRVSKLPEYCLDCVKLRREQLDAGSKVQVKPTRQSRHSTTTVQPLQEVECGHAKVAILFSGGLDSAVLAALAHKFVPPEEPIDLLNVAFEKQKPLIDAKLLRRSSGSNHNINPEICFYNVPDRITGFDTLAELVELFPKRKWNFVEVSVTQEELKREREESISQLIFPLNTVLDDSLGCALWFASRGVGVLRSTGHPYTSPARIVLSGIGADEQLGGYMRHRTTLKHKGGWEGLDKELQLELCRLSERNLGRDDRVVSSHSKLCRTPYLDEGVVNYLSYLPPWYRCNPVESMPPGLGDKLLLRLAAWRIGFRQAANLPKRAMQFGSRIANSREKGCDVSERL